jgi:hypothetical protein
MANNKKLKVLLQGAEAWNRWRNKNPEEHLDLTGATSARQTSAGQI